MYPPSVVKYEVKICLQRAVNAPTPHLISFTCTPIWNESLLTHFQKETSLSKVPADIWTGNHVQINFGSWNHSVANLDQVQATLVTYVIRDFPGMYWHGPLLFGCCLMCWNVRLSGNRTSFQKFYRLSDPCKYRMHRKWIWSVYSLGNTLELKIKAAPRTKNAFNYFFNVLLGL